MSQKNQNSNAEATENEVLQKTQTPLDAVREQQAEIQNHKVKDLANSQEDIPGHSIPSDQRKHPQRQTNYSAD